MAGWGEREAESHLLGLEQFGMRFGLERMHRLTTALGLPQRRFAQVHVVGTNGKTSTARFTAAILERHGVRTGAYTSPHIEWFRERIQVRGHAVDGQAFAAAVERTADAAALVERTLEEGEEVTQFEALTASAFHVFAAQAVEVAVIEAGLGGRYDATNVIPSRVQALTSVDLEHTRWLGKTVGEIAAEKLAVVRDHATLIAPRDLAPEVEAVVAQTVEERHATLIRAAPATDLELAALGGFQRANFAIAAAAAKAILERPLDPAAVAEAAATTRIEGRLQVIGRRPLTVVDAAHNPAGAGALAATLPSLLEGRSPVILVASVLDDKDAPELLAALVPLCDRLMLTRCSNPRAIAPSTLAALGEDAGWPPQEQVEDPHAALDRARELAGPEGAVVATGSVYLVADLVRDPGSGPSSTL